MYACTPEIERGFFEVVCGQGNQPPAFRDPPLPPWLSPTILCQPTLSNDSRTSESLFIAPICCAGDKPQDGALGILRPDRGEAMRDSRFELRRILLLSTLVNCSKRPF